MDNVIDNLQIEIESSSTSASDNIKKLITSIRKLDKIGQGTGLTSLNKNLKKFADLDFSKVSRQLTKISNSLKNISRLRDVARDMTLSDPVAELGRVTRKPNATAESVLGNEDMGIDVPTATTSGVTDALRSTTEAARETGEEFRNMNAAATATFSELSSKLEAVQRLFELTSVKAQHLGEDWQKTMEKFGASDIRTITAEIAFRNAEKSAVSFEEQIKRVKEEMKNLNKSGLTKGLENFGSSLKRIALYRVVRAVIAQIGQAFKEGIGNLVQHSEQANETMSKLKSSTMQLKNSFGTALMPAITAITPLIVDLCDWLSRLLNSFNAVSAAISGKSTYTKAIKNNLDYADSLKKVQNATLGIDELNVIGENSDNDSAAMFEEVELSAAEIGGAIGRIVGLTAAIAGLLIIFKGESLAKFFKTLGGGIKNFTTSMGGMSNVKKGALSIALLAAEAYVCYNAFYDMFTGTKTVGEGLLALIPILAIVGVAMYAMWGPIGLIIAAVVAVIAGVVAGFKAVSKAAKDKAMEKFWKANGVAISDVNKLMTSYFKSIGIDKQQEWNETLEETNNTLIDAVRNYDMLWNTLAQSDNLDSRHIEQLSDAFNELADAANAVNKAAIGSLMSSIRTGIEMNITPALTEKLNGLITSLETAQDLLNVKVSGIKSEYQSLLNEISSSGGKITEDQRNKLNELRSQINTFTLNDNTSFELWATNIKEAIEKGINAGLDQSSIEDNIGNLTDQRNAYLETVKTNYASSVSTMKQLIELDKNEFGGALGFSDADLKTLEANYKAQVAGVNSQYNDVISAIIKSFDSKALNPDDFNGWKTGFSWLYDWSYYGEKSAMEDQQAFLKWLESQKGYATGGFPEDDSFIYVNPYEIVGKMSNGKNVVANNEQIVDGIKQGVYEATMAANANNNGGGTDFEVRVYLDGKEITATVEKNQKQKGIGATIYKGGVLNGI